MFLQSIGDLRLSGLVIGSRNAEPGGPLLQVSGATRMRMTGCQVGFGQRASAVFDSIAAECHVGGNTFLGPLSFYGLPGGDPSRALMDRFGDGQRTQLNGRGNLHLVDNSLQLLTIGARRWRSCCNRPPPTCFRAPPAGQYLRRAEQRAS